MQWMSGHSTNVKPYHKPKQAESLQIWEHWSFLQGNENKYAFFRFSEFVKIYYENQLEFNMMTHVLFVDMFKCQRLQLLAQKV